MMTGNSRRWNNICITWSTCRLVPTVNFFSHLINCMFIQFEYSTFTFCLSLSQTLLKKQRDVQRKYDFNTVKIIASLSKPFVISRRQESLPLLFLIEINLALILCRRCPKTRERERTSRSGDQSAHFNLNDWPIVIIFNTSTRKYLPANWNIYTGNLEKKQQQVVLIMLYHLQTSLIMFVRAYIKVTK